ncbi:MAG: glyoxylate reductase [Phycisphaerales bacterium]
MTGQPPTAPTVVLTRPLPGQFVLEHASDARVVTGPEGGYASRADLLDAVCGASGVVTWWNERVDAEFLDAAGDGLKVVCNFAVGHENIDHALCAQRGVVACNTPDAVTEGTADVAWCLLMSAARRFSEADRYVRSGAWERNGPLGPRDFLGQPIAGRTLCIVGAGRIGYATALRSIGWGMRVLYVARSRKPQFEMAPLNAERVSLEEGLRRADFVSVHTPLTPETRHQIGARELALMQQHAVLVNTARGPVVDEAALVEALREGRIFAAGLDVFEHEPRVHPGLVGLENVVMTPHFGSGDVRSRSQMTALCAANIDGVLSGRGAMTPIG